MLMPGTILGDRYEIMEKIGAGGMSIVYKARDTRLQRFVSIKELREEFVKDEEFVAKFRKEALAAASLSHPNIVGIYDVGNDQDIHYIVMEYIEGKTLKEVIDEEGPFESKKVLELGKQIIMALKHAHAKKIIHRDIKPQNILITNDHVLKVTDFGIAKAVDSSTVVAAGNAIGSVHYFSPEQAKGKFVNITSDLYSCGIVLFELATKRLPFEADTHISIALKHINEALPRPTRFNPNMWLGLEQIILKATDKSQGSRYQSADEMLADMEQLLRNPSYTIKMPEAFEQTILLTPEETDYIRKQSKEEENSQVGIEREEIVPPKREAEEFESIYEAAPEMEENDRESEGGETISTFYKVMVSVGGVLATLVIVIVIALFMTIWNPFTNSNKTVSVPNVKSRTVADATKLLGSYKLRVGDVEEVDVDGIAAGLIVEQDPAEGAIVDKKSTVNIKVSSGKAASETPAVEETELVELPDLEGIDLLTAEDELERLGLKVEIKYEESNLVAENEVIGHRPRAGKKVESGSTVILTVSKGKGIQMVKVPNLIQLTVEDARNSLESVGLALGTQTGKYSDTVEAGRIIEQSILAHKQVEEGISVNVVVSKGKEEIIPEEPTIETPSFPGNNDTPQDETPTVTTISRTISLPSGMEVKENYRIVAKLTTSDGNSGYVIDRQVSFDELPLSITLEGSGEGTLDVYIDDMSTIAYTESINFNN